MTAGDEFYVRFVASIEGRIGLYLNPEHIGLPGDSFRVRAHYDIDSEADFAASVEPLLLPGGGPHECIEPDW